ncbi:MAG: hypothetical protein M1562_02490 [Candidatus Marsarchaeota archaeon]|jgi:hypothetical protein|nr:hypothetical protein [Candidatus Marsarchaeota archaeon]
MPYIKAKDRPEIDRLVEPLIDMLREQSVDEVDGKVNYALTRVINGVYKPKYFNYNRAVGVLECVKLELYRRRVGPYEDEKIGENGDVS